MCVRACAGLRAPLSDPQRCTLNPLAHTPGTLATEWPFAVRGIPWESPARLRTRSCNTCCPLYRGRRSLGVPQSASSRTDRRSCHRETCGRSSSPTPPGTDCNSRGRPAAPTPAPPAARRRPRYGVRSSVASPSLPGNTRSRGPRHARDRRSKGSPRHKTPRAVCSRPRHGRRPVSQGRRPPSTLCTLTWDLIEVLAKMFFCLFLCALYSMRAGLRKRSTVSVSRARSSSAAMPVQALIALLWIGAAGSVAAFHPVPMTARWAAWPRRCGVHTVPRAAESRSVLHHGMHLLTDPACAALPCAAAACRMRRRACM